MFLAHCAKKCAKNFGTFILAHLCFGTFILAFLFFSTCAKNFCTINLTHLIFGTCAKNFGTISLAHFLAHCAKIICHPASILSLISWQWLFCRRRQFTLRDYFAVSYLWLVNLNDVLNM